MKIKNICLIRKFRVILFIKIENICHHVCFVNNDLSISSSHGKDVIVASRADLGKSSPESRPSPESGSRPGPECFVGKLSSPGKKVGTKSGLI